MQNSLAVPSGEKAERLVSYVILANMAALYGKLELAKNYLSKALPILERIASRPIDCAGLSRFAQLVAVQNGEECGVFFPFVGKAFIMPALSIDEYEEKKGLFSGADITLKDFGIAYFRLRFIPQEWQKALLSACEADDAKYIPPLLDTLLEPLFREPLMPEDPFAIANDNFILAGIIIAHNPLFAAFALQHADKALQIIGKDKTSTPDTLKKIGHMQQQIQLLQTGIQSVQRKLMGTRH